MMPPTVFAVVSLVLGLGLPPSTQAYNIKNVAEQIGVSDEGGNNIVLSDLAIPQRYHRKAEQFEVYMDLTENQIGGNQVFLGSQRPLLADLTLLTPDGPNGRALYSVERNTQDLLAGSTVTACTQLFKVDGKQQTELVCSEYDPLN